MHKLSSVKAKGYLYCLHAAWVLKCITLNSRGSRACCKLPTYTIIQCVSIGSLEQSLLPLLSVIVSSWELCPSLSQLVVEPLSSFLPEWYLPALRRWCGWLPVGCSGGSAAADCQLPHLHQECPHWSLLGRKPNQQEQQWQWEAEPEKVRVMWRLVYQARPLTLQKSERVYSRCY